MIIKEAAQQAALRFFTNARRRRAPSFTNRRPKADSLRRRRRQYQSAPHKRRSFFSRYNRRRNLLSTATCSIASDFVLLLATSSITCYFLTFYGCAPHVIFRKWKKHGALGLPFSRFTPCYFSNHEITWGKTAFLQIHCSMLFIKLRNNMGYSAYR